MTRLLRPGAAVVDVVGADKERKYSELFYGNKCRLVVVALETGCRWSPEAVNFIERLSMARARDASLNVQTIIFVSWRCRWTRMIAISCGRSFAYSLSFSSYLHALVRVDGEFPSG